MTTICFVVGDEDGPVEANRTQAGLIAGALRDLAFTETSQASARRIETEHLTVLIDVANNPDAGRGIEHVFSIKRISI